MGVEIVNLFFKVVILLGCLVLHELGHGYMALFCGDKTAKYSGRLSLNPLKHLDPIGSIVPIFMLLTGSNFIFGWAKPVPVNYYAFKNGRVGEFLVSISGSLVNFILMIFGALLLKFGVVPYNELSVYFIIMNMVLGVFNFLPIPPLDGSRALASFLGNDIRAEIFRMDRFGIFFIFVLSYFGILSRILTPIYGVIAVFLDFVIWG